MKEGERKKIAENKLLKEKVLERGFQRISRNEVFGMIRLSGITRGKGELKNRRREKDKVIMEFKDKINLGHFFRRQGKKYLR